ncbi:MAG: hypothetical protein NVS2B7_02580 [Herpetosiphon sp.]
MDVDERGMPVSPAVGWARFTGHIAGLYGREGEAWLRALPALLRACERRWHCHIGRPYTLSYNYVAEATLQDGRAVAIKVGFPCRESRTEIEALRLYDGRGSVRLLDADLTAGLLLLERLKPGTLLADLSDDARATEIAAGVMQRLWRPVPTAHVFPLVAEWAAGLDDLRVAFEGGTGPFPAALVAEAEQLFGALIGSMDEPVVLHGDLHHFNILQAEREPWLAIDPKGLVGEPAYETGALLRNPYPTLLAMARPATVLARRVDQLAEALGIDRARIRGWGLAQAVLAGWWSYESGGGDTHEYWIRCAQLIAALPE